MTLGAKLAAKEIEIGKLYERLQAAEARTSRAEASAPRLQPYLGQAATVGVRAATVGAEQRL